MSYSNACCTIAPVESNYIPVGKMEQVGDLPCYVVGPAVSLFIKNFCKITQSFFFYS